MDNKYIKFTDLNSRKAVTHLQKTEWVIAIGQAFHYIY